MAWFTRSKQNIDSTEKRDSDTIPDGMWTKCPDCKEILYKKQLEENLFTCPKCDKHFRIGSGEYFEILFDDGAYAEIAANLLSDDPLSFVDTKPYPARIADARKKTSLTDAMRLAFGKTEGEPVIIGAMDFSFVGGSMGSVVGEKFSRGVDEAIAQDCPFVMISSSGGARMQEAAISLMQLAKTSSKLAQLEKYRLPFISILTDPTTGGVTASYGMLGDINIAEPKALIAFAGPRVVEQTIHKKLPPGFQRSEFLLEHGFVDMVVHRKELKKTLATVLRQLKKD
ncbi:MAG: acetyl-CoA carboxylase, carboxyltransferase subunit beta [Bacteroidota bacterium]|nr:acetyl-CoA carboxylase, carboxyltransferase subunit beta [Bacteroidota bacterium]MDP4228970.1 acetyl-CoA carboxylase, carboxyltransferase subunit beta [Bacteroidota bacterium]MDP4237107.1 acetyl-CoA carboxylase, carboxyltransferase subunit beta [Bacteroidota bacterium]